MDLLLSGGRMLMGLLRQEGHDAGRQHVATLMKRMGIEALYRRPNTSQPAPGSDRRHKIYPYLPRKLAVTRLNHVRAMDITDVPMARGFVHLVAVIDWFSRKVLTDADIRISMDGKGAWRDTHAPRAPLRDVIERLWRTIEYEEVYLCAYASVPEARVGMRRDIAFHNRRRPHSSHGGRTPEQAYLNQPKPVPVVA